MGLQYTGRLRKFRDKVVMIIGQPYVPKKYVDAMLSIPEYIKFKNKFKIYKFFRTKAQKMKSYVYFWDLEEFLRKREG